MTSSPGKKLYLVSLTTLNKEPRKSTIMASGDKISWVIPIIISPFDNLEKLDAWEDKFLNLFIVG